MACQRKRFMVAMARFLLTFTARFIIFDGLCAIARFFNGQH